MFDILVNVPSVLSVYSTDYKSADGQDKVSHKLVFLNPSGKPETITISEEIRAFVNDKIGKPVSLLGKAGTSSKGYNFFFFESVQK